MAAKPTKKPDPRKPALNKPARNRPPSASRTPPPPKLHLRRATDKQVGAAGALPFTLLDLIHLVEATRKEQAAQDGRDYNVIERAERPLSITALVRDADMAAMEAKQQAGSVMRAEKPSASLPTDLATRQLLDSLTGLHERLDLLQLMLTPYLDQSDGPAPGNTASPVYGPAESAHHSALIDALYTVDSVHARINRIIGKVR